MVLIYKHIHKDSLQDHLSEVFSESGSDVPDRRARRNIALHAALDLEYLHKGCSPSLIHRDVKSSNIFITSKYNGKLTDFGLSRLVGDEDSSKVITFVKGIVGYLDPEYFSTNVPSAKSDDFSFGVVLLKLITGRSPIDRSISTKWNICDWVIYSRAPKLTHQWVSQMHVEWDLFGAEMMNWGNFEAYFLFKFGRVWSKRI